jgi:hypothetical protein
VAGVENCASPASWKAAATELEVRPPGPRYRLLLLLHRFQPGGRAIGVDATARWGGAKAAPGVAQDRGTSASVAVSSDSESESDEFRSICAGEVKVERVKARRSSAVSVTRVGRARVV